MLSIKQDHLTATVNPMGAELSRLRAHNHDYLWQGDPGIWSGRAPVLFPIVGTLVNDRMSYRGQSYEMKRHGIARHSKFTCIDQTDSELTMSLRSDNHLLKMYPWDFELKVRFALSAGALSITYDVINHDATSMIFTLGSHPAFLLPKTDAANKALALSDFDIHFEKQETLQRIMLDDKGLLSTNSSAFELKNNTLELSDTLFQQDALVFKNINSKTITLRQLQEPQVTVDTGGAPHLGIWAKPGARFVCIEPWFGTSDHSDSDGKFDNKPDMLTLLPAETFSHTVRITLG